MKNAVKTAFFLVFQLVNTNYFKNLLQQWEPRGKCMESKTAMVFTPAKLRYLLVLAQIAQENGGQVRCIEIAVRMGVARASVSRMLNTFVKEELVLQETARGSVRLTEKGLKAAERYMNRCKTLRDVLEKQFTLSDYDAQECALALVSGVSETTLRALENCAAH